MKEVMLPFHKRTAKKTDDSVSEELATGDIYEVIKAPHAMAALRAPKSQFPSAPSNRPRVFNNHYPDEVTTLMPAKGIDSFPPPPAPSAPPSRRTPTPARSVATKYQSYQRPSTQTNYRPMAGMPVQTLAPVHAVPAAPHSLSPMAMPRSESDSGSIPGTVITTRTKLLGRPTMSWSAALVAMGIFAGLVTAVVARGDGDALVDATAAFVDPGHASSQNATALAAAVQAPLMPMSLTSPTPVVAMNAAPVIPAPSAVIPPTVAMSDIPVMTPKVRPAPVAFAAPPAKREVKAAPPAVKHEAPAAAPKAEKPVVAAAPKASSKKGAAKGAAKGDLDAEAANALAQAQLAQSL
ncbi:MAG: hypothetical protein ABIP89_04115 [Polyangiaceae bacterium]